MQTYSFDQHSDELDVFLSQKADGVFYVGHASILVRMNSKLILFDPVCQRPPYLNSWLFFPSQVMDPRLLKVDAVFVSHVHQDHFDTEFLKKLDPSIKIYNIDGRPEFNKMFVDAGLKVNSIPPGKITSIGDGIETYGVLHEYNSVDSSVIIRNKNFSVYHGNDNFITAKTLVPMKEAIGDIDVACIPFAFIHWYPFLMDNVDSKWKEDEGSRLMKKQLDLGIDQAMALDAKVVIPFGANLVYHDSAESVMNKACLSNLDFVEYAYSKLPYEMAQRFKPMLAGAYVIKKSSGEVECTYKSYSKKEYVQDLDKFLSSREKIEEKSFDPNQLLEDSKNLSWLEDKVKTKHHAFQNHLIYVESVGSAKILIEVDLQNGSVQKKSKMDTSRPFHLFKVQPLALRDWLRNEITFEEVIGTRRFSVERIPNEYNLPVIEFINNIL